MAVEVRVLKEAAAGERRVAATPETVKKLLAAGARAATGSTARGREPISSCTSVMSAK